MNYQGSQPLSEDQLNQQNQNLGQSIRAASQRADQLLQYSQYPQTSQQYSMPVSLPAQQPHYQPQSIYQPPQPYQLPQYYQSQQQVNQQPQQQVQQHPQQVYQQHQTKPAYSYISGQQRGQLEIQNYVEYVPIDRVEIEYIPQQKVEYIAQEKKIREYQPVNRVIEKVPIITYETQIEYVPVEKVIQHVEYETREYVNPNNGQTAQTTPAPQGYNPVINSQSQGYAPKNQQYY